LQPRLDWKIVRNLVFHNHAKYYGSSPYISDKNELNIVPLYMQVYAQIKSKPASS